MAVLLVTFELDEPDDPRVAEVLLLIKKRHSWVRLAAQSYAVETTKGAAWMLDRLDRLVGSDLRCYVIELKGPWAGRGPDPVSAWLRRRLG
jgi:hypothetical protein